MMTITATAPAAPPMARNRPAVSSDTVVVVVSVVVVSVVVVSVVVVGVVGVVVISSTVTLKVPVRMFP